MVRCSNDDGMPSWNGAAAAGQGSGSAGQRRGRSQLGGSVIFACGPSNLTCGRPGERRGSETRIAWLRLVGGSWYTARQTKMTEQPPPNHTSIRPLHRSVCSTPNISAPGWASLTAARGCHGVDSSFSHWSVRGSIPHPRKPHGLGLTQTRTQEGRDLCIDGGKPARGLCQAGVELMLSDRAALLKHNAY